jgi:hypothetical protein
MTMTKNKPMTHDEIKRICVEWRLDGIMPSEIADRLKEMGVSGYDRLRVKSICRPERSVRLMAEIGKKSPIETVKEGATERKPKYELVDGFYTIFYGKNKKLRISESDVDKAFKLYTLGNLTMNQVALDVGLSRAEFYALKTAFSLTKTELPFTPEKIDAMTADDIAEQMRIEKKRLALNKFHSAKYQDIEKDNKAFHQLNYYFNLALEKIPAIDPKPFDVQRKIEEKDEKHLLVIADVHAGAISNNRLNKYNFEIMRARFEQTAEQIINLLPPCEIVIADSGDKLVGAIHGSLLRNSEGCVDSIFEITQCYTNLFLTLIKHGFSIEFHSISGNHDSIFPVKTDRSDDSSFSRIVDWALQLQFKHFKQIKFIEAVDNMALIRLFDYGVLLLHGDKSKKLGRYQRLFKERIIEIIGAHYHSYSAAEDDNIPVYRVNSFCGNDEYATGLGLHSEPGVRLITYGKRGRICDRLLRFDC